MLELARRGLAAGGAAPVEARGGERAGEWGEGGAGGQCIRRHGFRLFYECLEGYYIFDVKVITIYRHFTPSYNSYSWKLSAYFTIEFTTSSIGLSQSVNELFWKFHQLNKLNVPLNAKAA